MSPYLSRIRGNQCSMRSFHTAACCSTNNITIFKSFRICNFCVVYLLKQIRLFLPFSSSSISLLVFSLSPSLDLHFHIVAQFSVFTRNVCFCVHTNAYAFKSHHLMECDFSQRSLSMLLSLLWRMAWQNLCRYRVVALLV